MKLGVFIISILMILSCNGKQESDKKASSNLIKDTIKVQQKNDTRTLFSEKELKSFLDSIGKIPTDTLLKLSWTYPDSLFNNRKPYNHVLKKADFVKLKTACKNKESILDSATAKNILIGYLADSIFTGDSVPITYFSFNKDKFSFNEYAICIGDPSVYGGCGLYFFKKDKLISKHDIYHKYGLELEYFKDIDGNTVIYYKQLFQSGSGIWWFNFYFYKYDEQRLIPILNEVENANLQFPWHIRAYWLESTVIKTRPLTLKMVYYVELPDSNYNEFQRIIDDSTMIKYKWNEKTKHLEGNYKYSKISKEQILSYNLDANELLFIKSHFTLFKQLLSSNNADKKQATLQYLNDVKNHQKGKEQ